MMTNGTPIEYTAAALGTTVGPNDTRFTATVCERGMLGQYVGPHPNLEGWHLTVVRISGEDFYCPALEGQFKPIS